MGILARCGSTSHAGGIRAPGSIGAARRLPFWARPWITHWRAQARATRIHGQTLGRRIEGEAAWPAAHPTPTRGSIRSSCVEAGSRAPSRRMALRVSRFFALLFVALALGVGLAHVITMPGKMLLSGEVYLTVQQLYRDWGPINVVTVCALLSLGVLAW